MRNRYAGDCYVCGRRVEPGTGHFERHRGGWRVKHAVVPGDGRVTCEEATLAKPVVLGGLVAVGLLALLALGLTSAQGEAMARCLKGHSYDTCALALNR